MSSALDRARGALVGLAVGDAVGTTLEFQRPGTFAPITDMVGGGPFGLTAGMWTDDTSMALCLAESILDTGRMDLADQLHRYLLWADDGYLSSNGRCFDIGITTRSQLDRFRRTQVPVDPDVDQEAAANGSLKRLAGVPIRWHEEPAIAAERSGESSRATHPADRPVDACQLLGAIIAAMINGLLFTEVTAPRFWSGLSLGDEVAAIADGQWKAKVPPAIRGTGYCIDALEAALWAVAGASEFKEAVLRAANLGDDADTTAAIAGQIAGARWGASGIPTGWLDRVVVHDRIDSLARRLFLAGGTPPEDTWPYDQLVHGWWVEPGRLLAGEYPGHVDPTRAEEKLNVLVDAGVRTFIDLTTADDHLNPYQPILDKLVGHRRLDIRRWSFPIPDNGVVDDEACRRILFAIDEAVERGPTFVHCWGGVGRTGTVIGCRLAQKGLLAEEVLGRLAQLRSGTRKGQRSCPERGPQQQQIRRFAPRSL